MKNSLLQVSCMIVSISLSFLFFGRLHQRQLSTTSSSFSSDAIIAIQQWKWNGAGGGGGAYYCQKAPTATTKSQTAGSYYRRHHSQYVVLMFRWLFCVHISTSTRNFDTLKFIYSEKATTFCEIFLLLLTAVHTVKSKGKILWPSQNIWTLNKHHKPVFSVTEEKVCTYFYGNLQSYWYKKMVFSKKMHFFICFLLFLSFFL